MGGVGEKKKEKRRDDREEAERREEAEGNGEGWGAGPDAGSFRARPAQPRLAAAAFFLVWLDDEAALPLRPASRTRRSSGNARSGSADARRPRFFRCGDCQVGCRPGPRFQMEPRILTLL